MSIARAKKSFDKKSHLSKGFRKGKKISLLLLGQWLAHALKVILNFSLLINGTGTLLSF